LPAVIWTVTDVALLAGKVPTLHEMTPALGAAHVPAAGVTLFTTAVVGTVAVKLTLVAATGPLFVIVAEYVSVPPS